MSEDKPVNAETPTKVVLTRNIGLGHGKIGLAGEEHTLPHKHANRLMKIGKATVPGSEDAKLAKAQAAEAAKAKKAKKAS